MRMQEWMDATRPQMSTGARRLSLSRTVGGLLFSCSSEGSRVG